MLGTLEIIKVPEEEGRRYCIHLKKPDVVTLKKIKADKKLNDLQLGKYNITENYNYERI